MNSPTPFPPPPTDDERRRAAAERAQQSASRGPSSAVVLMWLGILTLLGAGVAYYQAAQSTEMDNPFINGDQSVDPNYSIALFLAVAGAVLLVLAAILADGSRKRD